MSSAEQIPDGAPPPPHAQESTSTASNEPLQPSAAPQETVRRESDPAAPLTEKPAPAPAKPAVHAATPPRPVRIAPKRVAATPPVVRPQPVAKPIIVAARKPVAVSKPAAAPPRNDILPQSTFSRLTAGLTAVIVPHFIAERLGLIHVGGGQGLWAIVETDTLVFDALLFVVLYYIFRGLPRGAWRNPSFWLVVMTTAGITVLLTYTISNFGTLFRHRGMIFIGLCLLLVVTTETHAAPEPLQPDASGGS
jgi:hypothetical protein